MTPRFTIDGSGDLETHLTRTCDRVRVGVRDIVPRRKLQGILLGGGYGRGEGGVLSTEEGDKPYNDLEFYVLLRGSTYLNERKYGGALHELGRRLSPAAGVDVEFKILSLRKLRSSPPSMFYYDLMAGHRWVLGEERLLARCRRHTRAELIPLWEAARLLMNRCSGLLFAQEKLAGEKISPEDEDFIFRNQAKAQLAFGDVVLAAEGVYDWSCRTRHMRLLQMEKTWPWLAKVKEYHRQGVAFKLRPQQESVSRATLETRQKELKDFALQLWLWLEGRRLTQDFSSARDYARSPVDKCPETRQWRNVLVNVKAFGVSSLRDSRVTRYPRERVFNALALLLWEPELLTQAVLLRQVQTELNTDDNTSAALVQVYRKLWEQFN